MAVSQPGGILKSTSGLILQRVTIADGRITPAEAEQVILNNPFDQELQVRNDETRIPQLGERDTGRVLVVVSTMREELIRV